MAKAVTKTKTASKGNTGRPGIPRTTSSELTSDVNLSPASKRICESFRTIRIQSGLTQGKFAESIGVNLPYLKAVEQGRFAPADQVIYDTAKLYKRSIDWIFGLEK